ncbi:MAG: YlxR family protein [Nocardioidaceae bacterium]
MSRVFPVRTCVGCRERAAKSDLLRVVAVCEAGTSHLVPDQASRLPGRGAHLHPTLECFELAERRRAFPRALRLDGPLEALGLRAWIEAHRFASTEADVDSGRLG